MAALTPLFETNGILPSEAIDFQSAVAIATYPLTEGIIAYEQVRNRTNISLLVLTPNI
ncbi:hypothetical protein [Dapis sp. BLCC M229]|uniref:hypothetical protein n=1 Tax=Dapis sp. BLCC M229 TaxID=3400188 RepID=UPI003CF0711B